MFDRKLGCALAAAMATSSSLISPPTDAGSLSYSTVSAFDQTFFNSNARNVGGCLTLIEAGASQPQRLLVGMPGSRNPSGGINVGRTNPVEILANGNWAPLPAGVQGSPTGDVSNSGYYGWRCDSFGTRHVVSQNGFLRAHVYNDGVIEQSLIPTLTGVPTNQAPNSAVAIHGNLLALGAPHDNGNRGRVHLWSRAGTTWTLLQVLDSGAGATVGGQFGWSLDLYGEQLVVGAPAEGSQGLVHAFRRNATTGLFDPMGSLLVAGGLDGATPARIGHSVAINELDGSTLIVGAPEARLAALAQPTGAALLYRADSGTASGWQPVARIEPPDGTTSARALGSTVALRGLTALAADPENLTQLASTGAVYAYTLFAGAFTPASVVRYVRATSSADLFGWSLSFLDGDGIAVGAPGSFSISPPNGIVYQFGRDRLLSDGFETP